MKRRLLVVEDEPGLALTLSDRLTSEGHAVETASDGDIALHRATREGFDLIVLDVMLPGRNGFDICRELRRRSIDTPILFLTARGLVADKVVGLKLGADDYLVKPFEMIELLARIEVILRRAPASPPAAMELYQFGGIRVDFRGAEVTRAGEVIELSSKEFHLLRYLIEHRGVSLSREELLKNVWRYDSTPLTRTVDVHIAWLRQKLETNPRNPQWILTVHGMGYKFIG
jgi:two-component system alkaline phosphatase synthesis response regulator PhoP